MQAVILVGGEGTRLRPLTYETPKPMVPLFGIPFLERTLRRLRDAGVEEAVLAAGYLPRAIEDHFGDGARYGLRVTYVIEESPLGTAGALRNVAEHIKDTFFVLNGDILTDLDLRAMVDFHRARGGIGTLHAIRVDDPSPFGCIVRGAGDRISAFIEKPRRDAPTDEINAGTYLLERRVLDAIPGGRSVSIERETFPELLAGDQALHSFVTNDYWIDIGQPAQYRQAHDDVLDGKLELLAPDGHFWKIGQAGLPANLRPPVYIGAGATIDPLAVVGPHAVIGSGCSIAAGAHVRYAVLWDGVRIEPGARVSEAILASNVVVGHEAVVEAGAVVGHEAEIEPGTVLEPDARVSAPEGIVAAEPVSSV